MKNFISCHCHQASLDTAATPEAFAAREVELGTGYLVTTDHGTLGAAHRVYTLAKKKKLTPIIGLEAYLRDDDCPILKRFGVVKQHPQNAKGEVDLAKPETLAHYAKYMHVSMHFLDQEAYETGVRLLSKADDRAEKHGSERKPLFTWADLEELGGKNVTMTSSCLVGVVQRHLLDHDNLDHAIAYYEKLRGICKPGNFYTEVFPHKCDANWDSSGYLIYQDGTRERLPTWKKLKLLDGGEAQLQDFKKRWRPGRQDQLLAVMENRKWADREPKIITGIDISEGFVKNECRPWAEDGDVQRGANMAVLYLADKYGDRVLIGDDSHYAKPDEKIVQDIRLQSGGGSWRFYGHYHRQGSQEALEHFRATLGTTDREFESWVENSYAWAERFKGFSFKARQTLPTSFYPQDTLGHTMGLVEKHGRMRWEDPIWVNRLAREIELLHENGTIDLLPYFFIDEEVCDFFAQKGLLTGPGRGSAAGLLLSYLLRITHVDPIKYQLSMERFLTASRIRSGKMPDIDQDLSKQHRDLLIDPVNGWLRQRFGDCQAAISTDVSLKLRSAIKDVARVLHDGYVPQEIEVLTRRLSNAPQGISDADFVFGYQGSEGWVEGSILTDIALQEYVKHYPQEWEIVQKCLGLTRQKSKHACAYVIGNEPIRNFIPLTSVGQDQVTVTQYTAASVEAVGGLKMDFLGLNSLDDIAAAIKLVQKRHGVHAEDCPVRHGASVDCVPGHECDLAMKDMYIDGEKVLAHEIIPFQGKFYSVWKLPEDQAVFRDFCEGRTETVFQFSTEGVQGWMQNFNHVKEVRPDGTVVKALDSIEALSAFTALDRPGPLDYFVQTKEGQHNMLVEFAIRARGGEATGALPILDQLLPETHGVIVYQEQLQRVYQHIGQTTAEQADEFRVHISKKKMAEVIKDKEIFMPGAIRTLGEEVANELWQSMETFGQYGFNKSHATAYVVISYACAFLKHHFPLEWWTAVLRHADKDEISSKFWPHCGHLIDLPDVALSGETFEIVNERIRAPLSILLGVGDTAHAQLMAHRPYKDLDDFCQKIIKHQTDNTVMVSKGQMDADGKPVLNEDGTPVVVTKPKKGHNALNKGIIATLIVSGAMDSLFPEGTLTLDAMDLFVQAMVKAKGKKRAVKADKFDEKYLTLNDFIKYQMRKAVLPAYVEPCLPLLLQKGHPDLIPNEGRGRPEFTCGPHRAPFSLFDEIQHMDQRRPWPRDFQVSTAAAGYVVEARKFQYGDGKSREAMELVIDIDGGQMKAVKWGGKTGRLPESFRDSAALKGAIVVALYSKFKEDRPFIIEDLTVIQPPLDHAQEQSPDSE
jgi:DNA-directed DNA polymerase III PolC